MLKYLILSLPRSRSKWLSTFLSYPPFECGHDLAVDSASVEEFVGKFNGLLVGTIETGAINQWQAIQQLSPKTRIIIIQRNPKDVLESFRQLGYSSDILTEEITKRSELLRTGANVVIDYKDLVTEETCSWLFRNCLSLPFDKDWWISLRDKNIQVDVKKRLEIKAKNETLWLGA